MNRSSGIIRLKWAKLVDQVVNLNKGIYISIPSLLLESLVAVNLDICFVKFVLLLVCFIIY